MQAVKVGDTVVVVDSSNKQHSSTVTVVASGTIQAKDGSGKVYDGLRHVADAHGTAPYWRLATEPAGSHEVA